ncbi:MAG: hypothetical protein LLF92_05320 [Planctomycetaceae bacterium]|nr:hypothetical protein [Planctomycetaceae bacterium]
MNSFSNDVDILKYEPILFGDLHFAGQVLAGGSGATISNSILNAAGGNFTNAQITAGMVVYVHNEDRTVDCVYEIVSVNSDTQLAISVLRADNQTNAIPVQDSDAVNYRICTYQAQSNELLLQLAQYFGLRPGVADGQYSVDDILDASVLKQVSVYGVLSIVYATLASKADSDKENFWKKSGYYRQLYEKAFQRCKISIDLGNDEIADFGFNGSSVRLMRD